LSSSSFGLQGSAGATAPCGLGSDGAAADWLGDPEPDNSEDGVFAAVVLLDVVGVVVVVGHGLTEVVVVVFVVVGGLGVIVVSTGGRDVEVVVDVGLVVGVVWIGSCAG
jgi:hypothetical protein